MIKQAAHRRRPPTRLPCITPEVLDFAEVLNGKGFIMEPTILEKYHNIQTNFTLRADCSISAHAKFVTFGAIASTSTVQSPCDMKSLVDHGFACDQLTAGNWSTMWPPGNYLITKKTQLIHLVLLRREGNDLIVEGIDSNHRPFGLIDPTVLPYSFGLEPQKLIGNFTIFPVEIMRRTILVAGRWALKNAARRAY